MLMAPFIYSPTYHACTVKAKCDSAVHAQHEAAAIEDRKRVKSYSSKQHLKMLFYNSLFY